MYAIASGEMFGYIDFFGPFEKLEDAMTWAEGITHLPTWIVKLNAPD